ncbi:hypothetical protein GHT90_18475 [Acinetobacter baumannii]|nr:hypothetical protein [Acinetobacter baumannii]
MCLVYQVKTSCFFSTHQEELLLQFGYNIGQGFLFESAIDANQVISILKQGQAYLESHYSMN